MISNILQFRSVYENIQVLNHTYHDFVFKKSYFPKKHYNGIFIFVFLLFLTE